MNVNTIKIVFKTLCMIGLVFELSRNVVIAQQGGNLPTSTKDGVTVA